MTKIAEKSKQEYGDLLKEKDHLQDMEQLEMTIVSIQTPYPSIVRIQGKINTLQPELWQAPNLAIRLIVNNQSARGTTHFISRLYGPFI